MTVTFRKAPFSFIYLIFFCVESEGGGDKRAVVELNRFDRLRNVLFVETAAPNQKASRNKNN